MEKIVFNLDISYETTQPCFKDTYSMDLGNLEDFKRFINNPQDLWKREDVESYYREYIFLNESYYYVDKDGNVVDEEDLDDDLNYNLKGRSKTELEKMFIEVMKEYDEYLANIEKGNYSFNMLRIYNSDSWSFEDIKECIRLAKDKVKQIDLEPFTLEEITDIVNSIDISDNVELKTRFNYNDTCSCSELKELITYLTNIKNYINRFDLTPLEICIFLYDLIREREFNESEGELKFQHGMSEEEIEEVLKSSSDSRSLFKVFKSDKIVCAGFSNLYSAILELVGVKSENAIYLPTDDSNTGHMSNLVYLNDDFYDVHGVFEVDTTWGRNKNKDGSYNYDKSIHNYFHFMRPVYEAENIKKHHKLDFCTPKCLINPFKRLVKRVESLVELGAPNTIMASTTVSLIRKAEMVNENINSHEIAHIIDKLRSYLELFTGEGFSDLKEYFELVKSLYAKIYAAHMNPFAFRKALYNVKMIEHSIDKDKYPFVMKDFNDAFNSRCDNPETRFISVLMGQDIKLRMNKDRKLDMARMELLSVLHKAAQDNVDKNPVHHI